MMIYKLTVESISYTKSMKILEPHHILFSKHTHMDKGNREDNIITNYSK